MREDRIEDHEERILDRYESKLRNHDSESPEAVHWVDEERVRLRYDIITDIADIEGKTVLDFGCGTGLLLDYLKDEGIECDYYGWDISEEMINSAEERHPEAVFESKNILKEATDGYESSFDFIVMSGVFHIKTSGDAQVHKEWTYDILEELWPLCTEGIAVNFMTEHVDWRDDDLYYCQIDEFVEFCVDNLSRWFTIRRDYELWEHTVYVYKEAQWSPER